MTPIASLTVLRQLLLERVIAGQNVAINQLFADIASDIEEILAGKPLTEYKGRRLAAQIKGIMEEPLIHSSAWIFDHKDETRGLYVALD